jgi:hypothetical protein
MFKDSTFKEQTFIERAKVVSPTTQLYWWGFVVGALSHVLPHRFTLAGYPVVATRQQYSTARINIATFQSSAVTPRFGDGVSRNSGYPSINPSPAKPFLKWGIVLFAMMIFGGSGASPIASASSSFSNQQIHSFMKVVTSKLEQAQTQRSTLGTFAPEKLTCYSVFLGEGNRNGSPGLYTWFTCSGIHNAVAIMPSHPSFSCTGFSSAVWIQPAGNTVNYSAVHSAAQYLALRSTAPRDIQKKLSASYNLVHQPSNDLVISRAIPAGQDVAGQICS